MQIDEFFANVPILPASPAPHRSSSLRFVPSTHPIVLSAPRNVVARDCPACSEKPISTPTTRIRSGCCARAASGHVAATNPVNAMNLRRFIGSP